MTDYKTLSEGTPMAISLVVILITMGYFCGVLNERVNAHDGRIKEHDQWIKDISDIAKEARLRIERLEHEPKQQKTVPVQH